MPGERELQYVRGVRVSVVFDSTLEGWTSVDHWHRMEEVIARWDDEEPEQEYQVGHALIERGHIVHFLPIVDDPSYFLEELREQKPDVVFNCTEAFQTLDRLDFVVPALLEAEGLCYTGAPPAALMTTRNKGLSKKILAHHGVHVPQFLIYRLGEKVPSKPDIDFPVIVKPLKLDASSGISQASLVRNPADMAARVEFIHSRFSEAAIVEQFIEGRELYAGLVGNGKSVKVLPPTELVFAKGERLEDSIATKAAKWDEDYRKRKGISNIVAGPLPEDAVEQLEYAAKTAFRAFWLRDYARLDVRLDADDRVWVLEVNANPYLSKDHEMSIAAEHSGVPWEEFIESLAKGARRRFKKANRA